ncbi:MAG TPA: helix-turn-helix transcriptional regulator [Polyangia bacterium]|nr:helix-turn-helix transcriptional regulator [Polyangia bacterium]
MAGTKHRSVKNAFGKRLQQLRKARGLTQTELGNKVGISFRMIAYYEGQTNYLPTHVLPQLARALGVSVDELTDTATTSVIPVDVDGVVWRRFLRLQDLPPKTQATALQQLDALLDKLDKPHKSRR